jgi:tRNA threonylcarbamoyl adenosine modification protein (Sua5/YciO/YrdC/YwlC family)
MRPVHNWRMGERLELHPENPQPRLLRAASACLQRGGVIAYPTDSCYALGCALGAKDAMERIQALRQVRKGHFFTVVCRDLSEIARFARVENWQYRLLRSFTPGPYVFVLKATRQVPRRLLDSRRKTVGIRVPDHAVVHALLREYPEPILSTTLQLPGDIAPMTDGREIQERIGHALDFVLDAGNCGFDPSTIVDLSGEAPRLLRAGKGDPRPFQ